VKTVKRNLILSLLRNDKTYFNLLMFRSFFVCEVSTFSLLSIVM
jgi:hypothetical protein